MDKIRVLQWHFIGIPGGVAEYMLNNWKYIDRKRFEFDFITSEYNSDMFLDRVGSAKNLKVVRSAAVDRDAFFKDMTDLFRYGHYDAVHFNTSYWAGHELEKLAINCGIPKIIIHSHSTRVDIDDQEKRIRAEQRHELKKAEFNTSLATDFCACSNLAADWLFGPQIPRNQIKIMKNAIKIDNYLFNKDIREKYRSMFGIGSEFVIGHVGRIAYQKNPYFLIDMFRAVCDRISNVKLLYIGTGLLEEEIKQYSQKLGVFDKIIFTGQRNDVNNLYQAMDMFVLPSRFEGLPIVMVEAQTAGLKCIASNLITDEVCITNNAQLLPLDKDLWANKVIEIYKGYERRDMTEEITASGYNICYQIKEVEKLYME